MAIRYSAEEISKIHASKKAVFGQFYEDADGNLYIGRADGYLKKEIATRGEVAGTSLQTVIENMGDYSREQILALLASIENLATKEELADAVTEAKCFSVAMSLAL